jgi:phage-related protein
MTFKLFGHDVSASRTFASIGKNAAGVAAGMGAAFGASKVVDFARNSINAFSDLGAETMKLQRYMGGSAEDASRLAHAFTMSGVSGDVAARGIGTLEKHLAANDKAAKALGISFQDANGKVKPMGELMPQIAEKFKNMPAGAEKSALALQLFGKNGMAMLPFLNKGAAGVQELMAESDKLGTTLSGKDLEAVKANTVAKRKFGEALKGLQVTIGKELYPILTKLAAFMTEKLVPAFRTAVDWIKQNKAWLVPLASTIIALMAAWKVYNVTMAVVAAVTRVTNTVIAVTSGLIRGIQVAMMLGRATWLLYLQPMIASTAAWVANTASVVVNRVALLAGSAAMLVVKGATIAWTAVQWALNAALSANPIGIVVMAIVALVAGVIYAYNHFSWFRKIVDTAWKGIQVVIQAVVKWFMETAWPIIKRVIGFMVEYYKVLWKVISWVFQWISGVISAYVRFFRDYVLPAIRTVIGWIVSYYRNMQAIIHAVFSAIHAVISWFRARFEQFAGAIRTVVGWINGAFHSVWQKAVDVWTRVWNVVVWVRDKLRGAADSIKGFFSGIWDGIKEKAEAAFNWIKDLWNRTLGGKGFHVPGTSIGFSIPYLAAGGIAMRPTLAMVGEAGPEAIVPLSRASAFLGDPKPAATSANVTEVHVHVSGSVFATKEQMAREVVAALQNAKNRGLQLNLAG